MWLVQAQHPDDGDSTFTVVSMTGVLSASPTYHSSSVGVGPYGAPPTATQPGMNAGRLDTNNARVLNAAWRDNRLVAAHTAGRNGVAEARWYEFSTAGAAPTLTQSGWISPPGVAVNTYFPAIDIALNGDLGMSYMESSTSEFISMYVTGRTNSDPLGTMEPAVEVQAGQATYVGFPGNPTATPPIPADTSPFRAGDYSGISVDPTAPGSFWAANEFAAVGGSRNWGTEIANFSASLRGTLRCGYPVAGTLARAGDTGVYSLTTDGSANQQINFSLTPAVNSTLVPSLQVYNTADGRLLSANATLNPASGALEVHSQLTLTPNTTFIVVVGSVGGASQGAFTVSASRTPLATNHAFSATANTTLDVPAPGLQMGDSDPDGLPMTAWAFGVLNGPATTAAGGTVTVHADGSFEYVPPRNYIGPDSFRYDVTDANGFSNVATVSLTVNAAPLVAPNRTYRVVSNTTLTTTLLNGLLANFVDPNGLTPTALRGSVSPVNGRLLSFNSDGTFSYAPNAGFRNNDTFTYQITDGPATSQPGTVTLIVGQPPVAADLSFFVNGGSTLFVGVANGLVGANSDAGAVAHFAGWVPGSPLLARGLTLNADGSFTFAAPAGQPNEVATFQYYVTNPDGTSGIGTVDITIHGQGILPPPGKFPQQPPSTTRPL
jgi:hypothetical protein